MPNMSLTGVWRKLKQRLKKEGSEVVTNCHGLKLKAVDGKKYRTDCANTEGLFRIIQSIPSPKAEPFKRWLAKVGYERVQEIENPELAQERMKTLYEQKGYPKYWIDKRLRGMAKTEDIFVSAYLNKRHNRLVYRSGPDGVAEPSGRNFWLFKN